MKDWDSLFELADNQCGYFTLAQAGECGFSSSRTNKQLGNRIERVARGIYRLRHYPLHEMGGLIVYWLWSDRVGVFSHGTALFHYNLSDILPKYTTMTVPLAWKASRRKIPQGLRLEYSEKKPDFGWFDSVPITTHLRTLWDIKDDPYYRLAYFDDAVAQCQDRGLITFDEATEIKNVSGVTNV